MATDLSLVDQADEATANPEVTTTAPRARSRLRPTGRRANALVLLAYLTLTVLVFRNGWSSPTTKNIGGPNDSLFNMWLLRWTPWALANGENPLFTDHLNFPYGVNMMWNALMPLHGIVLWPVTAIVGPLASYNALVTLNVAFSAWCAYLALGTFVASRWAAVFGGLVYGFSPFMMAQSLEHPTLTAAYLPPLVLLALRQILVVQDRSAIGFGAILGLLASVQLFIAEEMLAAQALVGAVGAVILMVLNPRSVVSRVRHGLTALGGAAGVFLLLSWWALRFQFFGPQRITGGQVQPSNVFVSDLANFVVPTRVQQVVPGWVASMPERWSGNAIELNAYVGLPLILVVCFVIVRQRRNPVVRVAALLGAVMAVLSLGPNLHVNGYDTEFPLPWRAVESVPLLGHILPSRLMVFVFLLLGLLVALFADDFLAASSGRSRVALALAGLAVGVSLMPDLSYPSTKVNVPRFFTDGAARLIPEGSVALIAPFQQLYPADPMLWQAVADMRFRMPQGYFFAPDEQGAPRYGAPYSVLSIKMYDIQADRPAPLVTPELRVSLVQDLSVRQVQTVIVGPMPHQEEMIRFFTSVFAEPPEQFDDVFVWQRTQRLLR